MSPRCHIARLYIGTLVCLLIALIAEAAPPEGKPVLVPIWKKSTIGLGGDELDKVQYQPSAEYVGNLYARAVQQHHAENRSIIPPTIPTVDEGLIFYANDGYVVARAAKHGIAWGTELYRPGEVFWAVDRWRGLFDMSRELHGRWILSWWLKEEAGQLGDQISHRTLCHQFMVRGARFEFLDEIGFLPFGPIKISVPPLEWPESYQRNTESVDVDVNTGKKLGGFGNRSFKEAKGDSFIIMALPLIKDDMRIYLRETDGWVSLLRLDYPKFLVGAAKGIDSGIAAGRKWETQIARSPKTLFEQPQRRIHALHLVEIDDKIITPTNLGRISAVFSESGKIRWTHEYAPVDAKRFPTFAPEWVVVPPVVVGDKYIYAPADFPELLCLNVADGKKVWSVKKGDGLYPAVVGEQVLVIGEKTLRSLSLKDGSEQWKIDLPGLPCGRGAVLGDTYLLPISEPKTWRGMIAIVDLKTQKIREVLKPDKDEPIGNLVVHQDMLISQTLTEIAVFPIRN